MAIMDYRVLASGQLTQVMIASLDGSQPRLAFQSNRLLLEAPNWTLDGSALILNGNGRLWRLDLNSAELVPIKIDGVPALNNDHVLAPDGETIYVSANDWHIYRAPLTGGTAERVTNDGSPYLHFLHGVSPDGGTLAYVGLEPEGDNLWARANIFTIPAAGGTDVRLTDSAGTRGRVRVFPRRRMDLLQYGAIQSVPGHAQIARMQTDGSRLQQLTFDDAVNWFPHISPDGRTAVYLSFPTGTVGHPADLEVHLKVVRDSNWQQPRTLAALPGGQGTINVNSWSPTSEEFAYVAYPMTEPAQLVG